MTGLLVLWLVLGIVAFALKAAAGGFTAVDPSRLAPTEGARGLASPAGLEQVVAAAQLGSNLAAALAGLTLGLALERIWGGWGWVAGLAVSGLIAWPLLEILPLLYGAPRGGRRLTVGIFAVGILAWPLKLLRGIIRWVIERIIPGEGPNSMEVMAVRREAFGSLADEGDDERTLREAQKALVTQVYEFGESTVEEVMVPRGDVIGLPAEATVRDAVALAGEHQFSRYPVFRGTLDQVEGVLHIHDLLAAPDLDQPVSGWVRGLPSVPAAKKCDELLSELQRGYHHAAMVVDEFGGTAGWVTVEDLLEELVGEIRDEHDVDEETVRVVGRRAWLIEARIRLDDLNRALNAELPEGDYETLAGYLLEEFQRIPKRGETVDADGHRFLVVEADGRRIVKVRVERTDS